MCFIDYPDAVQFMSKGNLYENINNSDDCIEFKRMKISLSHVATDPSGPPRGRGAPPQCNFFHFHAVFSKHLAE